MKNKIISFLAIVMFVTGTLFGSNTIANTQVKPVDVHFISTGNSDCILISDNGKYAMIDGADNDDEKMLVEYLNKLGIKELEYLILTHPDADHVGGLDAIVKNFTIKKVFVGNGKAESKTYKDFINTCMNKKLQPSVPLEDKTFALGNGTLKFYNQKANSKDVNDDSLVTLYANGSNKFLFTGDAGVEVEKTLPLKEIGKVDLLKVGHHGSKTSSSDSFIKTLAPKYGVILCGKDNKYGHPHKEALDILNKYKVTTYRTDLNGTIVVTSNSKDITIKSATNNNNKTPVTPTITSTAPSTPQATKQSVTQAIATDKVYVTKTGKKYHKASCSSLSASKIELSKEDALAQGYTPCSKCNP